MIVTAGTGGITTADADLAADLFQKQVDAYEAAVGVG
jgi:hypothetical protein